jgi:cytochrome c oxidase subunit 2
MIGEEDLKPGYFRLLETTARVVLPTKVHIRVLVTSADVLQLALFIKREGIYYGQCSEICGVNHGFMPIVVEAVSLTKYSQWFSDQLGKNISFTI